MSENPPGSPYGRPPTGDPYGASPGWQGQQQPYVLIFVFLSQADTF